MMPTSSRPSVSLMIASFFTIILLVFFNSYYASRMPFNLEYFSDHGKITRCSALGDLADPMKSVPIFFYLLGTLSVLQMLIKSRFTMFMALSFFHFAHVLFVLAVFIIGNSYCQARSFGYVAINFQGVLVFSGVLLVLPIPALLWQFSSQRNDDDD
jgi:hypothetical protein